MKNQVTLYKQKWLLDRISCEPEGVDIVGRLIHRVENVINLHVRCISIKKFTDAVIQVSSYDHQSFNPLGAEIINQAAQTNTALEVSASPLRLDLNDIHCRLAVEACVKLVINTDTHEIAQFPLMRFGVATAQRGWATKNDVLNCQTVTAIQKWVKEKRGE